MMQKDDMTKPKLADISAALTLLSRLPAPVNTQNPRGARTAWCWPLIGAFLGLLAAISGWIALALGLPVSLSALVVLGTQIIATGAMHEDGLADCADGFWGGWDKTARLEIMKDSRIGTYGVLALGLSVLARWAALVALMQTGWIFAPLIAVGALSRTPMVAIMTGLKNARKTGLSASVGRPDSNAVAISGALAFVIAVIALGWAGLVAGLSSAGAGLVAALVAKRKIGGQTGDVLGATQQLAEIAALAALTGFL